MKRARNLFVFQASSNKDIGQQKKANKKYANKHLTSLQFKIKGKFIFLISTFFIASISIQVFQHLLQTIQGQRQVVP